MSTHGFPPPMNALEISREAMDAMRAAGQPIRGLQANESLALERLVRIAQGCTGQSRRVADFLLAWWSAGTCGSFDLTTLWGVDEDIAADMVTVFAAIARVQSYPDSLGYEEDFNAIVREWRPELKGD